MTFQARAKSRPPDRSDPPPSGVWSFVKRIASQFSQDDAMTLAGSMSFYAALALAPLIVVVLAIAGAIWGRQAASEQLVGQFGYLIGEQGAQVAETVIEEAGKERKSGLAAAGGAAMLLFAATGLFAQLQYALNRIWEVKPRPGRGWLLFIRKRLLSLGMILTIGFLLLISLVASAAIHALTASIRLDLPGSDALWQGMTAAISIALFTLLFAGMFKYLPDAKVPWRTVWIGAAVTAILFALGKQALGLYLGRGGVGSAYGAAGSLVVVLVWVYYSSIILFLGAEFTQVYAAATGHAIEPSRHAQRQPSCPATEQKPRQGAG